MQRDPRFLVAAGLVLLTATVGLGVGLADAPDQAPAARLYFVPVPAEKSGLTHVVNRDEAKYGKVNWLWMSPLVDINGDGHLDILVCGHHGGTGPGGAKAAGAAAVWLGKGNGAFVFDDRGYDKRWNLGARDPLWIDLTGNGAMDAILGESAALGVGRIMRNDGTGHWQRTELHLGGNTQFIDTDGDGRHDGVWFNGRNGKLFRLEPPLWQWGKELPEKITLSEVADLEKILPRPSGIPERRGGGFREAYSVDLNDDQRNELVVNFQGGDGGFHSSSMLGWVLSRRQNPDGQEVWVDTTRERGLPTGVGHCFYPEDIDVDGHLDLVDLQSGHWYKNDGKGSFVQSPHRLYDQDRRKTWSPDLPLEWVDLNNNGYRDLSMKGWHGFPTPPLFLNQGNGRFVEMRSDLPLSRSRTFADVDGDHRLDMLEGKEGQIVLHRNETPFQGMQIRLVPRGHAEAQLGAKLWVYQAGHLGKSEKLVHYRQGFQAQRSHRHNVLSPNLHVGLGTVDAVDIRVRFASGIVREVRGAKAGTRVEVKEAGE